MKRSYLTVILLSVAISGIVALAGVSRSVQTAEPLTAEELGHIIGSCDNFWCIDAGAGVCVYSYTCPIEDGTCTSGAPCINAIGAEDYCDHMAGGSSTKCTDSFQPYCAYAYLRTCRQKTSRECPCDGDQNWYWVGVKNVMSGAPACPW